MAEEFDRQKLIREKIEKTEERAVMDLGVIRDAIGDYLLSVKEYSPDDIETDRVFEILIDDRKECTSVDYIIRLGGKRFMAIKCSPGALESRDRHLLAFARVVDECVIPYALCTDGSRARLLDAVTGKLVAEGLESIPRKLEAVEMMKSTVFSPCPAGRIEKERRILLAFDAIKCTQESCE